jgi:two-component system sensor histidine kinase DesK
MTSLEGGGADPPRPPFAGAAGVALFAFLLFIGFPLYTLFAADLGPLHLGLALTGLVVFVASYLATMWATGQPLRGRAAARAMAPMAAVALALALDNSARWSMLFIYVAAAAGLRLAAPWSIRAIGACAVAAGVTGAISGQDVSNTVTYVIYTVGIGFLLLGYAHLLAVNAELEAAREKIARLAVDEERLRFARDLHDLLGHSLSVIALKSELARRILPDRPEQAGREIDDIERVTRDALGEVRDAVSGYRHMTLSDELAGARTALAAAGIDSSVERAGVDLPAQADSMLAWAVREGTTNVIRHSQAHRCAIRITANGASAVVEVADDGLGGSAGDGRGSSAGTGLAGLTERIEHDGGALEAGTAPEGGFRLRVSVPVR